MSSAQSVSPRARFLATAAALLMLAGLFPAAVGAAPPSGAPTLLNPADGATVSSNPVFSWSAVSGAAKYRVQISHRARLRPARVQRGHREPEGHPAGGPAVGRPLLARRRDGRRLGHRAVLAVGSFTKEWGTAPIDRRADRRRHLQLPEPSPSSSTGSRSPAPRATRSRSTMTIEFILPTTFTTNNTNFTLTEPQTIDQSSSGGSGPPPRPVVSSASGRSRASTRTTGRRFRPY